MPIANCIISQACSIKEPNIVAEWAKLSGLSDSHMTVNLITRSAQFGHQYEVMVNLLLPSLWSKENVSKLQLGLAKALSRCLRVSIKQVHIVTSIIDSGLVVENGEELTW